MTDVSAHGDVGVGESPRSRFVAPRREGLAGYASQFAVVWLLLLLLVLTTVLTDGFWNLDNLRNVATQNAPIALVALGFTFLLICGAFDLSLGAVFAAGGVVFADLAGSSGIPLAMAGALLAGAAAGVINGTLVTRFRVDPFVSTVGTGSAFAGAVLIYSGSQPISASQVPGFRDLAESEVLGIPLPALIVGVAFLVGGFVLSRTVLGRYIYATGGNAEAARLAGIPVDGVRMIAYIVVGISAAAAGVMTASQVGTGQPTIGAGTAIDAFTIVVIGGTSVYGGRGAVWRTLVGVAILAILNNFFNFLALEGAYQSLVKGAVLVTAVTIDAVRHRNARA
jgi:ribose transport system permease protein